ncbi:ferro-O2-oxidoreductase [Cryptococcus neoformans c45]|nr:ferro-O2-oxidoreductase [Cryptococcus neoformans var. grubii c45]
MTRILALFATVPLLAQAVSAATVEHWWNISYAVANPDGLFERRVIGVNGSWPPPPLLVTQGDTILIHAYNGLNDPNIGTALHTHGISFNGSNYYDGAVGITQCSIPMGETLDYVIDTNLQAGTFWMHGHYLGQYIDGLRSPLVIEPQNATGRSDDLTWDDDYTLVVSDWYHRQHLDLLTNDFLTWENPTGAEPVPDSAVIYLVKDGRYYPSAEDVANGAAVSDNLSIPFEAGKKYKIRVINMSALAMFYIALDQHNINVIEVDGVEIEPYSVDALPLSVAQRYSILVEAKNETDRNYAMTVMQDVGMYDYLPDELVLNNTIQISYSSSSPPADEVIYPEGFTDIDDTTLTPLLQSAMAPADIEYTLHVNFDTYDDGTNRGNFNNVTFQEPPTASIFTALTMGNASFLPFVYGAQTNAFTYPHMANIQLTVYNWDAGSHPFHFHGHEFQVVQKSFDVTDEEDKGNGEIVEGQENPMRRDTITIPATGKVVLRWRADNPGAWFFHCHIDWHLSSGLAAVFIEAPEKFQENTVVPQTIVDHCKYWGLPTSGNVVGLNSTTDFDGQPWGPFPLVIGWTPSALISIFFCVTTAFIGIATVLWYNQDTLESRDMEEHIKRKIEAKKRRGGLLRRLRGE